MCGSSTRSHHGSTSQWRGHFTSWVMLAGSWTNTSVWGRQINLTKNTSNLWKLVEHKGRVAVNLVVSLRSQNVRFHHVHDCSVRSTTSSWLRRQTSYVASRDHTHRADDVPGAAGEAVLLQGELQQHVALGTAFCRRSGVQHPAPAVHLASNHEEDLCLSPVETVSRRRETRVTQPSSSIYLFGRIAISNRED